MGKQETHPDERIPIPPIQCFEDTLILDLELFGKKLSLFSKLHPELDEELQHFDHQIDYFIDILAESKPFLT